MPRENIITENDKRISKFVVVRPGITLISNILLIKKRKAKKMEAITENNEIMLTR